MSGGLLTYLLRRWDVFQLKLRLLREPDVAITDVPVLVVNGEARGATSAG